MIAVYYILKALGLAEGSMIRIALIVVFSAGSGVGFYVAYFDTIPKEQRADEAIADDGQQAGIYQHSYSVNQLLFIPI